MTNELMTNVTKPRVNRIKGGFLILIHKGPILERNEKIVTLDLTNFYKLSIVIINDDISNIA